MKIKLKIMLSALVLLIIIFNGLLLYFYYNQPDEEPDWSPKRFWDRYEKYSKKDIKCQMDGDCIKLIPGCGGCNSYEPAIVVHRVDLDYLEPLMPSNNLLCYQVVSLNEKATHWTCDAEAKCVKGKCMLVN